MVVSACMALGQSSSPALQAYDSLLIHQFTDTKWVIGKRVLNQGELRKLLRSHPASSAGYERHRKNRTAGNALQIAAVTMYAGSFFLLPASPEAAIGVLIGSVATSISSVPFSLRSRKKLYRAIWLYNRSVLAADSTGGK